jgi:hypothetical protein
MESPAGSEIMANSSLSPTASNRNHFNRLTGNHMVA